FVRNFELPETGNRVRGVKVPRILRQPDEVADVGITRPSAAKRRTRQLRRDPWGEKGTNIRSGGYGFDRWKLRQIKAGLRRRRDADLTRHRIALVPSALAGVSAYLRPPRHPRRLRRLGIFCRLALASRPACDEVFLIAHHRSFCVGPRRASASGSARSRSRLWNGRSTWRSATKASIAARTAFGIGTTSTRSLPVSVQASPSAGTAGPAQNSHGAATPGG